MHSEGGYMNTIINIVNRPHTMKQDVTVAMVITICTVEENGCLLSMPVFMVNMLQALEEDAEIPWLTD